MKLIRTQIDVQHFERTMEAMMPLISGMTIWEAREDSKEANYHTVFRGQEYEVSPPRYVMEIVSDDSWVDDVLRALADVQRHQPFGDANVRVFDVDASYHVRTGFMDI